MQTRPVKCKRPRRQDDPNRSVSSHSVLFMKAGFCSAAAAAAPRKTRDVLNCARPHLQDESSSLISKFLMCNSMKCFLRIFNNKTSFKINFLSNRLCQDPSRPRIIQIRIFPLADECTYNRITLYSAAMLRIIIWSGPADSVSRKDDLKMA